MMSNTVILRCILLPELELSELAFQEVEKDGDDHCILDVVFLPESAMVTLSCRENDDVRIENKNGEYMYLRARMFSRSMLHVQPSGVTYGGNIAIDHTSADSDNAGCSGGDMTSYLCSSFVYASSSVFLEPGQWHQITPLLPLPRRVLKSVSLCRVVGHTYPRRAADEDIAIRHWFTEHSRGIRLGDVIPVPISIFFDSRDTSASERLVSWYQVVGAAPALLSDPSSVHTDEEECVLLSVPSSTAIILNEDSQNTFWSKKISNRKLKVTKKIFDGKYEYSRTPEGYHSDLSLSCSPGLPRLSLYQSWLADYREETTVCPRELKEHLQRVSRLRGVHLPGLTEPSRPRRAYSAALLHTADTCDAMEVLSIFAREQGMKIFEIDYRHFLYAAYESSVTKKSISGVATSPRLKVFYDFGTVVKPSWWSSPAAVSSKLCDISGAPCVLCFTSLDYVLESKPSDHAVRIREVADKQMGKFIHSLFTTDIMLNGVTHAMNETLTIFGICSGPLSALSPEVLQHFPQHIRLPPQQHMDAAALRDYSSGGEYEKYSNGLGFSKMMHFVQEVRLSSLQRGAGSSWEWEAFRRAGDVAAFRCDPRNRLDCRLLSVGADDMARVQTSLGRGSGIGSGDDGDDIAILDSQNMSKTYWDEIGGVESVRDELLDTLLLCHRCCATSSSTLSPSVWKKSPRRTGILLHGPPGTGKTLVAKAVATECGMAFISVKGPELLDMYIGESERQVRSLFERAKMNQPCVLFFDELDSLAPARGGNASGGGVSGVMDRVVSQLLIEMDNISNYESLLTGADLFSDSGAKRSSVAGGVFVIGATNRPDLLDQALLRPGRFDKKIFLGPCESTDSKIKVLNAQTKNYRLHSDVDFDQIAYWLRHQPATGAELSAIVSTAYEYALDRKIMELDQKSSAVSSPPSPPPSLFCEIDDSGGCHTPFTEGGEEDNLYRISEYLNLLANDDSTLDVELRLCDFQDAIKNVKLSASSTAQPP